MSNFSELHNEIGDEFGSTFFIIDGRHMQNMFREDEKEEVEAAIKKFIPDADIRFTKVQEIGSQNMYLITDIRDL